MRIARTAALALVATAALSWPAMADAPDERDSNHPTIVVHYEGGRINDVWLLRGGTTEVSWDERSHAYRFYDSGGNWTVVGGDTKVLALEPEAADDPQSLWFRYHEWHADYDRTPYLRSE